MDHRETERRFDFLHQREFVVGVLGFTAMLGVAGVSEMVDDKPDANIVSAESVSLPLHRVEDMQSYDFNKSNFGIEWLPETVSRWHEPIRRAAGEFDVNPKFISIIMTLESGGWEGAVSPAGAKGLMQVMPETGAGIASDLGEESYDLQDPETSIRYGTYYLRKLLDEFNQSDYLNVEAVELVAAGYNGGPSRAHNLIKGEEIPTETAVYKDYARGFWSGRYEASSPSFERWVDPEHGNGQWLLSQAD